MPLFCFTKHGRKEFERPPKEIQSRVITKLKDVKNHPNIFSLLKKIQGNSTATHRLRVGQYRILLTIINEKKLEFLVISVGRRSEIYRG